ncbi:MAG TPA: hypothetical protein VNU68_07095 [Verrucomicrobiae bacterium]|nr:hypothetical protein [Verrucomicrobiae bacterium]
MIEEVRFVRVNGRLILQCYDGHVWYTPRVVDIADLTVGQQSEVYAVLGVE